MAAEEFPVLDDELIEKIQKADAILDLDFADELPFLLSFDMIDHVHEDAKNGSPRFLYRKFMTPIPESESLYLFRAIFNYESPESKHYKLDTSTNVMGDFLVNHCHDKRGFKSVHLAYLNPIDWKDLADIKAEIFTAHLFFHLDGKSVPLTIKRKLGKGKVMNRIVEINLVVDWSELPETCQELDKYISFMKDYAD